MCQGGSGVSRKFRVIQGGGFSWALGLSPQHRSSPTKPGGRA